ELPLPVVMQIHAGECIGLIMQRLLQLRRTECLRKSRSGERSIGGEAQRKLVDLWPKLRHPGQRIRSSLHLFGQNDLGGLVSGEGARVDPEGGVLRRRVGVVQAEVAGDEVGTTIVIEVSASKAVPPTAHWRQSRGLRHVAQSLSV